MNLKRIIPQRPKEANKNDFGRVMAICGSRTMVGAAYLVCKSAFRAGVGLVYCALPESEKNVLNCMIPEVVTIPLPSLKGFIKKSSAKILLERISKLKIDVISIGPGLGIESAPFVVKILSKISLPCVIDADALNAIAHKSEILSTLKNRPCILTPHEGEMRRLIGNFDDRKSAAMKLSHLTGGITVLKGNKTLVSDGVKIYVNKTGSPALAKAGSGDVLTGIIAAIWAQNGKRMRDFYSTAFEAAAFGAYIHGLAGELAAKNLGDRSLLSSEIANFLALAFRKIK